MKDFVRAFALVVVVTVFAAAAVVIVAPWGVYGATWYLKWAQCLLEGGRASQ